MGQRKPRKKAIPGSALAQARRRAHNLFDPLWQSGKMSRTKAYIWLAAQLQIPVKDCHMLSMDEEMCQKVIMLFAANEFEDVSNG